METVERRKFTDEEKKKILSITNCKCGHCGCKLNINSMTVEHIYPLNKGGTHSELNLVALCQKCNNLKSNFIYEPFTFYPYIKDNLINKYQSELINNVFKASTDKNIFGSLIRVAYSMSKEVNRMILSKKNINECRRLLTKIGKPIEARLMYEGDLDTEALELIRTNFYKKDENDKKIFVGYDKLNTMLIKDLLRYSSAYGFYIGNTIVGIVVYTNIEDLELSNNKVKDELKERGFNKTYVKTLFSMKEEYTESIAIMEANLSGEYMAVTGNLIVTAEHGIRSILTCPKEKQDRCFSKIDFKNGELILGDRDYLVRSIVLDGDFYRVAMKSKERQQAISMV